MGVFQRQGGWIWRVASGYVTMGARVTCVLLGLLAWRSAGVVLSVLSKSTDSITPADRRCHHPPREFFVPYGWPLTASSAPCRPGLCGSLCGRFSRPLVLTTNLPVSVSGTGHFYVSF